MFIEVRLFKVRTISHAHFHANTKKDTYYILAENEDDVVRRIDDDNGAEEIVSIKELPLRNGYTEEDIKCL